MGFFKKPVAQNDKVSDEQIRREIRARVAKQVGIYDEEYINTGKIGGTKKTETPVDTVEPAAISVEAAVEEAVPVEAAVEVAVPVEVVVVETADAEATVPTTVIDEKEKIETEASVVQNTVETTPEEVVAKPIKQVTPAKSDENTKPPKEAKPQKETKTPKEPKQPKEPKPTKPPKEPRPLEEPKAPKEPKPPKAPKEKKPAKVKKSSKKRKSNIALILFIVALILAFIPLYYFLTGGNIKEPVLKVSSPDSSLYLTQPLLVRGMVSDSENLDGVKVYYSLDNGSASLLYTFKADPGPFESEIEMPDTPDYLGEHSVTIYAENPIGELSKETVLNFNVAKPGLTGVEINTPPAKVQYVAGESLDLTGLVVIASYEDGKTAQISDYTSDVPMGTKLSKIGETPITISYLEEDVTKTVTFSISVQMAAVEMPSKKVNGIYPVPAFNE